MANERHAQEIRTTRRFGLPFGLQFSLFELLAILLFAGVGAAALRGGGNVVLIVVQAALWLFVGVALLALIARGAWQAFAIGFVLGVAGYGIPPLYVGVSELDPYEARLPLSKTLLPVWHAVMRNVYRETQTGEEFGSEEVQLFANGVAVDEKGVALDASAVPPMGGMGAYTILDYRAPDGRVVHSSEKPFRHEFMLVAHFLFAVASGYVFGKITAVIYRRRTSMPETTMA